MPPNNSLQPTASGGLIATQAITITVAGVNDAPTVVSITRADPNPTYAASVCFRVAFSEAVQNVDVNDFTLATTGISRASVMWIAGGATYTVTVDTSSGNGTLRLDISATATITDLDGKPRFVDVRTVLDTGRGAPPIVDMGAYETQVGHLIFLPLVVQS